MMEQSRHARKFFDLAWFGIGAAGAVDPMAAWLQQVELLVTLRCRCRLLDSCVSLFDYVIIIY